MAWRRQTPESISHRASRMRSTAFAVDAALLEKHLTLGRGVLSVGFDK